VRFVIRLIVRERSEVPYYQKTLQNVPIHFVELITVAETSAALSTNGENTTATPMQTTTTVANMTTAFQDTNEPPTMTPTSATPGIDLY